MATNMTQPRLAAGDPLTGMLLVKLGRGAQRRYRDALRSTELSLQHMLILHRLEQGAVSQQALPEAVGVDASKLVGLLNDLETQGMVIRRRDLADRRRHLVEMSDEGRKRATAALAAATAVEDQLLAALSEKQRAKLRKLLLLVADGSGVARETPDAREQASPAENPV